MSFLMKSKIKEFNKEHDIFTEEESRQIVSIIIDEENLTLRQAVHYNFIEAFVTYGTTWAHTADLVEYVNHGEEVMTDNIKTMKDIMNTPTLFLLTSGRWIGWDY